MMKINLSLLKQQHVMRSTNQIIVIHTLHRNQNGGKRELNTTTSFKINPNLNRSSHLMTLHTCNINSDTSMMNHHRSFSNCSSRNFSQNLSCKRNNVVIDSFRSICKEFEIPLPLENSNLLKAVLQTDGAASEAHRLNFIGRNVTSLCIADYLFSHFPNLSHDHLTLATQEFLKKRTIVEVAKGIKLDNLLKGNFSNIDFAAIDPELEGDEERKGDLNIERNNLDSLLVFTVFRIVAAIFDQCGLLEARKFVVKHIVSKSVDITGMLHSFDPRLQLTQMVQTGEMHDHAHKTLQFKEVGKDEKKFITVHVLADGEVIGEGVGQTKKIAEQKAAQDALNKWFAHYHGAPTPLQKFKI
ncbi:hypothetical protein FDP41_011004 [Naegleria fowleri]|uniref:RNase III domain-containing protein n=1 Tax=Naegleria fowleri TaxID=5763 RepID=A0A6A5C5J2_NAEFO|nr:uncharacterized protein FDP41_011004 [Naegleria fowleri]KAF0983026.1 hypothetical protein FDP41_011004 [Naegleria fowleri]CAG4708403.1 unnamed protein product [Naegleria fowleri]